MTRKSVAAADIGSLVRISPSKETTMSVPRAFSVVKSNRQAWPHQNETAKFCTDFALCFDMSDPGTGKTFAHLKAYLARRKAGTARRCLVVCPKTLMRPAWGDEIDKNTPELSYAIADAKNRRSAFALHTDIVIVNTDGVLALLNKKKNGPDRALLAGFTDLIIDEVSSFKHPTAQRSKAMLRLSRLFRNRYILTGTPNPNSVTELWHPAMLLDGGERLGDSFFRFRNAVQVSEQVGPMPNMVKWRDKPEALDAVFGLLSDITIRHSFEQVMTHVPPNHRSAYDFELSAALMKQYRALEDSSVLALKDGSVTAVHAAALRNKLLQLASGAVYTSEGEYSVLDTSRYELIADLVQQYNHSIVFFNWRHQRDQLSALFEKRQTTFAIIDGSVADRERERIVRDFQDGKYQTILLHPRTGAHGLTLTRGEACILSSPIYEADLLKQGIHRIYRGAQDKVTNTILVQAAHTVEEFVYSRLDEKSLHMNDFLALATANQERRRNHA